MIWRRCAVAADGDSAAAFGRQGPEYVLCVGGRWGGGLGPLGCRGRRGYARMQLEDDSIQAAKLCLTSL